MHNHVYLTPFLIFNQSVNSLSTLTWLLRWIQTKTPNYETIKRFLARQTQSIISWISTYQIAACSHVINSCACTPWLSGRKLTVYHHYHSLHDFTSSFSESKFQFPHCPGVIDSSYPHGCLRTCQYLKVFPNHVAVDRQASKLILMVHIKDSIP